MVNHKNGLNMCALVTAILAFIFVIFITVENHFPEHQHFAMTTKMYEVGSPLSKQDISSGGISNKLVVDNCYKDSGNYMCFGRFWGSSYCVLLLIER